MGRDTHPAVLDTSPVKRIKMIEVSLVGTEVLVAVLAVMMPGALDVMFLQPHPRRKVNTAFVTDVVLSRVALMIF